MSLFVFHGRFVPEVSLCGIVVTHFLYGGMRFGRLTNNHNILDEVISFCVSFKNGPLRWEEYCHSLLFTV